MSRDRQKKIEKNEPMCSADTELNTDTVESSQPDNEKVTMEATENNELKELLSKKEAEANELLDRIQRLGAEYENFRKRTQKEKEKLYGDTASEVVSRFLPIADNLERALKTSESEEAQGLREGVILISKQLSDILDKLDVKPIESVGVNFNPELHNAVMHIEDENLDHNIIVEEFLKGYIFKDEIVIRHSMVKVAN